MPFELRQNNSAPNATLCCRGSLTIHTAEEFRKSLAENIHQDLPGALDLSQVTECDAAGLQLLISARKQAETHGRNFAVINISAAVRSAGVALGLNLEGLLKEGSCV